MDADPSNRRFDRLMAHLGLLDDAAPLFRAGTAIPGVAVLLDRSVNENGDDNG